MVALLRAIWNKSLPPKGHKRRQPSYAGRPENESLTQKEGGYHCSLKESATPVLRRIASAYNAPVLTDLKRTAGEVFCGRGHIADMLFKGGEGT